jgi:UDP-glucuronate 4-epimerase
LKKIFITGIAGFVGFHLAQSLLKEGKKVVGIDNFNDYYDPSLKEERASILKALGAEISNIDISDFEKLSTFCKTHNYSHFIHLAAQAGVRYSIDHPFSYVKSNLIGFVNVLEICRSKPDIPLIYASSSSVYGLNKETPFSEKNRVDNPVSLYGATKKSNESLAFSYHHLYKIPMIGLRFFTVYGPYGRPDMAYFSFSKNILEKKPIKVFNHGKLKRDFTYIDDIVSGIRSCLDLNTGFEIFNLGNNQPETLEYFISCIEKELGVEAIKEYVEMQKGDVLETYADISHAKKLLNFSPKTSLKEGLSHFAKWFKKYHSSKLES